MNNIICLAGPTASGKTALAVELAKELGGEVVSCDSMQIYRRMDIGTAKPTREEMQGIVHHMIDIVEPDKGHLVGTVTSVTFKGLNYDIIVEFKGFKWLIQTTDFHGEGSTIGIRLNPEDIHIMHKSEYSGMFGDYSSYSAEYDELTEDAGDEEE